MIASCLKRILDLEYVVGTGHSYGPGSELRVDIFRNARESTIGYPFYRELQRWFTPTLLHTAVHGLRIDGQGKCVVAFRIFASQDDEGVENLLPPDIEALGFRIRANGPDFVVDVHDGSEGYDRLMTVFNAHSVYLPPLTPEEGFDR